MTAPSLTIGIEEEYQIVNPETRELQSYITELWKEDHYRLGEIKPELHQSIGEVGTRVCPTPADACAELRRLRRMVMELAARKDLRVVAAGSHPFSCWTKQEITPLERYVGVRQDMQDLAQQLLIFGTHIHIGIEDREFLIDAMNVARYFIPHLLCLSVSSPFWVGRKTGLKSYRSVVFRNFPRTGIPRVMRSWGEYQYLHDALVRTRCIPDGSKIYWDVRPHHVFPTLEFRFLDACTKVDEAVCIAAILQAIVAKLWKMRRDNTTFRVYPADLIEENKWRAVRYGLDGNLVDFGKGEERPARELIQELIGWFIDDVVDELGSRAEVEYAFRVLDEGASADRQLRAYGDDGNLNAVVDHLIVETAKGV
jgi:carboxylate-amine ligase